MTAIYWMLFWFNFPILLFWAIFGLMLSQIGAVLTHDGLFLFGRRIALSADQMANTFAAGFPDETLSARVGRAIVSGRPRTIAKVLHKIIDGIFWFDPDHCVNAIEHDELFNFRFEPWPWQDYTVQELEHKKGAA